MKKLIASLVTVFFLVAVSGPVFADSSSPAKTPVAKSMKKKKKKTKKKSKAMKPSSTPMAK